MGSRKTSCSLEELRFYWFSYITKNINDEIFLLSILIAGLSIHADGQKIFSVDSKYDADIKVFVANSKYDADLIVFKCSSKYDAKENKGLWFFVGSKYDADKKVFFVDSKYDADLIIFFSDSKYDAEWKKSSKKQIMY